METGVGARAERDVGVFFPSLYRFLSPQWVQRWGAAEPGALRGGPGVLMEEQRLKDAAMARH